MGDLLFVGVRDIGLSNVKVKKDGEIGDIHLDLKEILSGNTTRVSTVKYYDFETIKENVIVLRFYNKNRKPIKVKEQK